MLERDRCCLGPEMLSAKKEEPSSSKVALAMSNRERVDIKLGGIRGAGVCVWCVMR